MTLTTNRSGDPNIFEFCDPIAPRPDVYHRDCDVPALERLGIGHGNIAQTQRVLHAQWRAQSWEGSLDGRAIDLSAFGTLPDVRISIGAGGPVWLRQWNVAVEDLAPGAHTLHYVMRQKSAPDTPTGTWDLTWKFTVKAR